MLQESLKPLQHGLPDPDEAYPIKKKNNHKYDIFIFLNILLNQKSKKKGSWIQKLNFPKIIYPNNEVIK